MNSLIFGSLPEPTENPTWFGRPSFSQQIWLYFLTRLTGSYPRCGLTKYKRAHWKSVQRLKDIVDIPNGLI